MLQVANINLSSPQLVFRHRPQPLHGLFATLDSFKAR